MKTAASANTAKATIDFVCPTWNNTAILSNFIKSFVRNTSEPYRLVIVNNGDFFPFRNDNPNIIILQAGSNLGWMGGVNLGVKWCLANNPAKYIGWINDDVQILDHDYGWLTKMLLAFQKEGVGAVGPTSNAIMGYQQSGHIGLPPYLEAMRLSGMCFITKKEVVDKVGFLDETLPGGDDLDYSIRIRKEGWKLAICRRTFMLHHYATTGRRVHGEYWDSRDHTEAINIAIIRKHGLSRWFQTINDWNPAPEEKHNYIATETNFALDELKEQLETGTVLDLGCGGEKIHQRAVGVDLRAKGQPGVGFNALVGCGSDVESDATDLKAFKEGSVDGVLAKHLLEHILDIPKAIKEWNRVLRDGGKLVIIVPDWRFCEAISCDPSHVHSFTPESLASIVDAIGGFKTVKVKEVSPGYVFGISFEKVPVREAVAA